MSNPHSSNTLIVGLGNPFRRDDGVGRLVAQHLRRQVGDRVTVVEESGEGASLMELWKGSDFTILIDAVQSGAPAGEVFRLDATEQEIPSRFFHYSTHAFSLAEAVELARAMDELPPRLVLYGIEGSDFSDGEGLSAELSDAVPAVVTRIREEIETHLSRTNEKEERTRDA